MDNEVKGEGNHYTTEFRQLDPRLGRWFSVDPEAARMPWQSPYTSMDCDPINLNDVLGRCTDPNCQHGKTVKQGTAVNHPDDSGNSTKFSMDVTVSKDGKTVTPVNTESKSFTHHYEWGTVDGITGYHKAENPDATKQDFVEGPKPGVNSGTGGGSGSNPPEELVPWETTIVDVQYTQVLAENIPFEPEEDDDFVNEDWKTTDNDDAQEMADKINSSINKSPLSFVYIHATANSDPNVRNLTNDRSKWMNQVTPDNKSFVYNRTNYIEEKLKDNGLNSSISLYKKPRGAIDFTDLNMNRFGYGLLYPNVFVYNFEVVTRPTTTEMITKAEKARREALGLRSGRYYYNVLSSPVPVVQPGGSRRPVISENPFQLTTRHYQYLRQSGYWNYQTYQNKLNEN